MRETDEGRRGPLSPTSGAQGAGGASDPPGCPWTTPTHTRVPWVSAARWPLPSTGTGRRLGLNGPRAGFGARACSRLCAARKAHSVSPCRRPGVSRRGPGVPGGSPLVSQGQREGGAPFVQKKKHPCLLLAPPVLPCLTRRPGVRPQGTLLTVFREHTLTCKTGRPGHNPRLRFKHQKTR